MHSWEGLIDDGLLVTALCPSSVCHLTVYKAPPYLWASLFLTKQLVLLENKWYLE